MADREAGAPSQILIIVRIYTSPKDGPFARGGGGMRIVSPRHCWAGHNKVRIINSVEASQPSTPTHEVSITEPMPKAAQNGEMARSVVRPHPYTRQTQTSRTHSRSCTDLFDGDDANVPLPSAMIGAPRGNRLGSGNRNDLHGSLA
jgi:hypothetical protein